VVGPMHGDRSHLQLVVQVFFRQVRDPTDSRSVRRTDLEGTMASRVARWVANAYPEMADAVLARGWFLRRSPRIATALRGARAASRSRRSIGPFCLSGANAGLNGLLGHLHAPRRPDRQPTSPAGDGTHPPARAQAETVHSRRAVCRRRRSGRGCGPGRTRSDRG
jgi:hypothetical protein